VAEHPRITVNPKVMVGKPVIRGTRITVELVTGLLAQGWTGQDIVAAYPHLTRENILACLSHAQDLEFGKGISDRRGVMRFLATRRDVAKKRYSVALCDKSSRIAHT
jgi:uncharacterized protein (DUF433 family)